MNIPVKAVSYKYCYSCFKSKLMIDRTHRNVCSLNVCVLVCACVCCLQQCVLLRVVSYSYIVECYLVQLSFIHFVGAHVSELLLGLRLCWGHLGYVHTTELTTPLRIDCSPANPLGTIQ